MTRRLTHTARLELRATVRTHAHARNGIFGRADLAALGIDPDVIRSFMKRGWWTRLHHGVYIDTDVLLDATDADDRARIMAAAAIAAIPGPAYAFGPTAAVLQGLVVDRRLRESASIVRPPTSDQRALRRRVSRPSQLGDVRVHRHHVAKERLIMVDGIPSVDRPTAAITTAAQSEPMWALATLDSLVWRDPAMLEVLPRLVEEWSGLKGLGNVRQAATWARTGAQSALESISRFHFMAGGLPEPLLQVPFYDDEGLIGYADFAWAGLKVIGEADGLGKYASREDLIAEKRREDRLRALGWIVVRWTWEEVFRSPGAVIERIWHAARQASYRANRSA
jgi:hypothetical protein